MRSVIAAFVLASIFSTNARAADCKMGVLADLPVTMEGLRASVPVKVNGIDTRFWLDSGAFFSLMADAKAQELGLRSEPLPQGFYISGVGGNSAAELATIKSFSIAGQDLRNIRFLVGGSDVGNGVIGRNILGIADTEFDLAHGSVKLIQPHNCGDGALAYWAAGKTFFTVPLLSGSNPNSRAFRLDVSINGARIEAELDSGAPTSLLSRRGAERAGIDLSGPGVSALSEIGGIGRRTKSGWIVPIESVAIGEEQILRTHLRVIDGPIADVLDMPDMLLGADFMVAHRIYVARSQRRIYFTYTGGRPFLTVSPAGAPAREALPALPAGTRRVEALNSFAVPPKTAAEFARRSGVRLAQRAYNEAIADLSEAIRLAPDTAAYYGDRAHAYSLSGQHTLSRADIDKALTLAPNDGDLLRERAYIRLVQRDEPGALADTEAAARVIPPSSLKTADLGTLFQRLHQPARAIALYDAVIAAHPYDAALGSLLNARCWARGLANRNPEKAIDDCDLAIKRDGVTAAYLDSRGLAYFRSGQFARAIADYDAALKLDPQLAWSLYVRGLARIAMGQADAGKADQTAAVAARPDIAEEARRFGIGQ